MLPSKSVLHLTDLISLFTCLVPGKTLTKASIIFQCFYFKVEVMMDGIIQAFLDRVSGVGWIDNQTVEAVREKV